MMKAFKVGISALIVSVFLTATSQAFPILESPDNFIFEECPTEIEQKLKLNGKCYLAWVGYREFALWNDDGFGCGNQGCGVSLVRIDAQGNLKFLPKYGEYVYPEVTDGRFIYGIIHRQTHIYLPAQHLPVPQEEGQYYQQYNSPYVMLKLEKKCFTDEGCQPYNYELKNGEYVKTNPSLMVKCRKIDDIAIQCDDFNYDSPDEAADFLAAFTE